MKLAFISILLLLARPVLANEDCYQLLTQNFSRDSAPYTLSEFDIVTDAPVGSPEYARAAVMALESQVGCELEGDAIDQIYSTKCRKVAQELDISRVCFVKTAYGYYFVTVDMLGNVNVIFNRFD